MNLDKLTEWIARYGAEATLLHVLEQEAKRTMFECERIKTCVAEGRKVTP